MCMAVAGRLYSAAGQLRDSSVVGTSGFGQVKSACRFDGLICS